MSISKDRKLVGLTQEALAELARVSVRSIRRLESGGSVSRTLRVRIETALQSRVDLPTSIARMSDRLLPFEIALNDRSVCRIEETAAVNGRRSWRACTYWVRVPRRGIPTVICRDGFLRGYVEGSSLHVFFKPEEAIAAAMLNKANMDDLNRRIRLGTLMPVPVGKRTTAGSCVAKLVIIDRLGV